MIASEAAAFPALFAVSGALYALAGGCLAACVCLFLFRPRDVLRSHPIRGMAVAVEIGNGWTTWEVSSALEKPFLTSLDDGPDTPQHKIGDSFRIRHSVDDRCRFVFEAGIRDELAWVKYSKIAGFAGLACLAMAWATFLAGVSGIV